MSNSFFRTYFSRGLRYAALTLVVTAVMGLVYGLLGGVLLPTAGFSVTMVGLFVSINGVIALAAAPVLLLYRLFGRSAVVLTRYLAYSLAFMLVFLPLFVLIEYIPVLRF